MKNIINSKTNYFIYLLYTIIYLFVLIKFGMGTPIANIRYYLIVIAIILLFWTFIQNKKANIKKEAYLKELLLIIPLGLLFFIMSCISAINQGVLLHFRTIVQISLVVIPPIYAFLVVNTFNNNLIEKLMKMTLIITLIAYFLEPQHTIIQFFNIDNWKNMSFGNGFIESNYCSGIFLQLFLYFHYIKYQNNKKIEHWNIYYILSIIFTILSFKRLSILFVIFMIIISKCININKKIDKKIAYIMALIFTVLTIFYFKFMNAEFCSPEIVYKLTSGRDYILKLWANQNYYSYGYGTSMLVIGRYLEMDLIQIYIELGVFSLLAFCFIYYKMCKNNLYSFIIITFTMVNLLTASALPSILSCILLFINLGIISVYSTKNKEQKKSVGIITLNGNYNFGNRLQNYALQRIIRENDYEVETIWITNKKRLIKYKLINFLSKIYRNKRVLKFYTFTDKHIITKFYLSYKNMNYDKIIVGSDQIWNPNFAEFSDDSFAKFSQKEKNIAYAASFGVSTIPERLSEKYKDGINNFSNISVREKAGVDIIKKLDSSKEVKVVLDPTFLLSENEWEQIIKPVKINKQYVLLYFLGNLSKKLKNEIEDLATNNDMIIINMLDKNSEYYNIGPSEFLYLIKNAKLVITDSFHATVFSIIFKRNFIIIERDDNEEKMNSRIIQLIEMFDFKDRYIKNSIKNNDIFNMNYNRTDEIIKKHRNESLEFLLNSLRKR